MNKTMTALGGALLLVTAAEAFADNSKIYMAHGCRATSGSVTFGSNGEISNPNATVATVLCPLVRDETTTAVEYIGVYVRDLNVQASANDNFQCRIRFREEDGSTGLAADTFNTPGGGFSGASGVDQIQMYLDTAGTNEFDPGDTSAIALQCTIPHQETGVSILFMYRIDENE